MLEGTEPEQKARAAPLGCSAEPSLMDAGSECTEQHMHGDRGQAVPLTLMSVHIHVTESLVGDACSFCVYLLTYKNDYVTLFNHGVLLHKVTLNVYFLFSSYKIPSEASRRWYFLTLEGKFETLFTF